MRKRPGADPTESDANKRPRTTYGSTQLPSLSVQGQRQPAQQQQQHQLQLPLPLPRQQAHHRQPHHQQLPELSPEAEQQGWDDWDEGIEAGGEPLPSSQQSAGQQGSPGPSGAGAAAAGGRPAIRLSPAATAGNTLAPRASVGGGGGPHDSKFRDRQEVEQVLPHFSLNFTDVEHTIMQSVIKLPAALGNKLIKHLHGLGGAAVCRWPTLEAFDNFLYDVTGIVSWPIGSLLMGASTPAPANLHASLLVVQFGWVLCCHSLCVHLADRTLATPEL